MSKCVTEDTSLSKWKSQNYQHRNRRCIQVIHLELIFVNGDVSHLPSERQFYYLYIWIYTGFSSNYCGFSFLYNLQFCIKSLKCKLFKLRQNFKLKRYLNLNLRNTLEKIFPMNTSAYIIYCTFIFGKVQEIHLLVKKVICITMFCNININVMFFRAFL